MINLINLNLEYSKRPVIVRVITLVFTFVMFSLVVPVSANQLGDFQRVETETLDEQDFVFPDDFQGESLNVVMLAISKEQDNGTWQGDMLVEWYAALNDAGVLSDQVLGYHFSVMKVPFFVKGFIRGAIAESYEGKLPLNQAGVIFYKKLDEFARAPGIALDGQPTLVLVASDGELLEVFKGEATPENIEAVSAAVATYLQPVTDSAAPDQTD